MQHTVVPNSSQIKTIAQMYMRRKRLLKKIYIFVFNDVGGRPLIYFLTSFPKYIFNTIVHSIMFFIRVGSRYGIYIQYNVISF